MVWYLLPCLPFTENIKKRACRYLLQRYLGNFLVQKLSLDQLDVDLYNGKGTVSDVRLDCEALNYLSDSQNWPVEIVDGYMQEISIFIPWATLLKDDSVVEVSGLCLTVQPKVRKEQETSVLESMWSSMSSSMQLAADCIQQDEGPPDVKPLEGIEMFAEAIDSILSRVKVKFINTKLRIEHVPKNSDKGIALEIHIKNINYFDEAGSEPSPDLTDTDKSKTYIVSTYTNKRLMFEGISFYTDEFPPKFRTVARNYDTDDRQPTPQPEKPEELHPDLDINFQSATSEVFYETRSIISNIDPESVKSEYHDALNDTSTSDGASDNSPDGKDQAEPVLFAKLTGSQELVLKMKNNVEAAGPKVELQLTLGSLIVFLTPRQMYTVFEIVNGLNEPHLVDTSNVPHRQPEANAGKPMVAADYRIIEAQLIGHFNRDETQNKNGWTGMSIDESMSDDLFFPMSTRPSDPMTDSFISSTSSLGTSATSSVNLPTSNPKVKRNKKVPQIDGDPTAEVSHINIKMSSISCILLHRDILIPETSGSDCVTPCSVAKLQEASSEFFNKLGLFSIFGKQKTDFDIANEILDKATNRSHLRLMASSLALEGSEKITNRGRQSNCEATINNMLLREVLYNTGVAEGFNLISFNWIDDNESESNSTTVLNPNVRFNFKQAQKYSHTEKRLTNPTNDLFVYCMPFTFDVDLTVLERISASLYGSSTTNNVKNTNVVAPPPTPSNFNLTIQCTTLDTILRFPIADLRAGINHQVRRVRQDYLQFTFEDVMIHSQLLSTNPAPTSISLRATTIDIYYYENENVKGTHIAHSGIDESFVPNILKGTTPVMPTISLTFKSSKSSKGPLDSLSDDEPMYEPNGSNCMNTSVYIMNNLRNSEHPSPFSNKKTAHQSITSHGGHTNHVEELIVPGSREEMLEFTTHSIEKSGIHLDFHLPILSLQLESKQLYEIIYNRINSDLLLWEPHIVDQYEISPHLAHTSYSHAEPSIYPVFSEFTNNSGYDSDHTSPASDDEDGINFEFNGTTKPRKVNPVKSSEEKESHNFCLSLKVGKGLLTIYAPVRDNNKRVVPGQMGEMVLEVKSLSLCQVSGLNGKPKTGQLCLRASKTTLYHESIIPIPSEKPSLRIYGSTLPSYLKETIYPSSKGVKVNDNSIKKDMLSMALKVEPQKDLNNFKKICLSLGIEQATLRHRGNAGFAWMTQLLDVLDVSDYEVLGYKPSTVLTELHVHVLECAVDYRPLYLPIRTLITIGNFSVSSNVIADTNTSCLRFLAQDCVLFLSHLNIYKPNVTVPQDDDKRPDIMRNYVSVVDIGLFELSLRMSDKAQTKVPYIDLCASNNMLNIHTCWDSASALCRLLTYLGTDGDCNQPSDPSTRHTSFCSDRGHEGSPLVGFEDNVEEIREISPSELQQVNDLMAEAMLESPQPPVSEEEQYIIDKDGVEVFYFPDESNMPKDKLTESTESRSKFEKNEADQEDTKPGNAQVTNELGDPTVKRRVLRTKRVSKRSSSSGNNTDDEYCIIDNKTINEDDDVVDPSPRWKKPGPLKDYFHSVPIERTHVLAAPKHFPRPCVKYTLCEMSVTWHMYGGNDFRLPHDHQTNHKKAVTINEDPRPSPNSKRSLNYEPYETSRNTAAAYRQGVRWSPGSERVRAQCKPEPARRGWKTRGGVNRDHGTNVVAVLNKVKFVYETYPNGGTIASRQTLAISKIEILDRLANSHINKFLTQYILGDEPERKFAHMLLVKAVHIRPDVELPAQECCLKISLLPLKFNIDQDTLAFITNYFSKLGTDEFSDEDARSLGAVSSDSGGSRQATPTHRPPVMSVGKGLRDPTPVQEGLSVHDTLTIEEPQLEKYQAERLVSENLIQLEEEFLGAGQHTPAARMGGDVMDDSPLYFRRVVFSHDVPIRLDYVGKRVDLSAGPIFGLLMGLTQLNCSELTLKRLCHRNGLLGIEKLIKWALNEWLENIKRHQLPRILGGIGPMHSLLQFVIGIKDLLWLPFEQWLRDGRIVHGLRRGAASFTARTAVAALDVTARILHIIQATAETAFDMVTPGPSLQLQPTYDRRERRRRARHDPARHVADLREGVASAYNHVREGFADTATTITIAARSERGVGVLRHLPGAAVAPLALAAAGAADVIGGVRAALAPDAERDRADKWRSSADKSNE